jgi:hypothetical protein
MLPVTEMILCIWLVRELYENFLGDNWDGYVIINAFFLCECGEEMTATKFLTLGLTQEKDKGF